MPIYQSRIGLPVIQPKPTGSCLYVKIDDMKEPQSLALWEAMKQHRLELAKIMARDEFIKNIRKEYGAKFMMERTEVEQLLNTQGMTYEDF